MGNRHRPRGGLGWLGLTAAAVAALSVMAPAPAARATVFDYDYTYDPADLQCGFFVSVAICGASALLPDPVSTAAGDRFDIHVSTTAPIQVPGSPVRSSIYVSAFDTEATPGPGAPGGVITHYQLDYTGLVTTNPTLPFSGPFNADRTNDYIGVIGYFGQPHDAFSVTGVDAHLTVVSPDPRPTIGLSVGYSWVLDSPPLSFEDLPGGTADSPVILPAGIIGSVSGSISGPNGPSEQFYNFNWLGGSFQTQGSVFGADPQASFMFQLLNLQGGVVDQILLDQANNFSGLLTVGELLAGSYTIGLIADAQFDPQFTITFLTPVGANVPEPATWALMLAGFGAVGLMARRRRTPLPASA